MSLPLKSASFNEKQLRAILDNTVDGIIVIDSKGVILSFNPACEQLFLYPASEVIGANVSVLMPDQYRIHHDQYLRNYMDTHQAKVIGIGREVAGQRKDKTVFPLWLSLGEVVEDDLHFFVGILRDISQQKADEEQLRAYTKALEKSNSELDEFVYLISHDLKEPVRGIYSFSQFLSEDYGEVIGEDGVSKLNTLMKMSRRMDDLIERLLYFSRLDRSEMSYTHVKLDHVLHEVMEMIVLFLQQNNAHVVIDNPLPTLVCDQARVGEIFRNLIVNGVKYNDNDDKVIHIGAEETERNGNKFYTFYVKDNGIGIPEKHFLSIFKMFKRLHARDAYGGGTGSGLTIVQRIVSQHGGEIWVESSPGNGATFWFTLQKGARDDSFNSPANL